MNNNFSPENKVKNIKLKKNNIAKRNVSMVFSLIFLVFTVTMGILFFVIPKKTVSQRENRNLLTFPEYTAKSLLDGSFTRNIDLFYSDNFAFRDKLVDAKFAINGFKGLKVDNITIVGNNNENYVNTKIDPNQPLYNLSSVLSIKNLPFDDCLDYISFEGKNVVIDNDKKPDKNSNLDELLSIDKEQLTGEKRGGLYIVGDTALEIFYGSETVTKQYAEVINEYALALGNGVTIYNLIIPNHFEYGLPKKYKGTVGRDQKPFIDLVKSNLDQRVIFVDIHSYMKEHYDKGEYLYFRSDHHWTGLGAYRAYEKFCEYANITPVSLDDYEKRTTYNFLGTLYNSSMNSDIKNNPDYVEYYVSDLPYTQTNTKEDGKTYKGSLIAERQGEKTNGYLTFMGGDIPLATIETLNKNGKKIIVFKESYGNAFVPFIVPHYECVYVADIRSFPYNAVDFIKNNGITDVLFINNIMAVSTSARVANIYMLKEK